MIEKPPSGEEITDKKVRNRKIIRKTQEIN